jgi:hypothetical protein
MHRLLQGYSPTQVTRTLPQKKYFSSNVIELAAVLKESSSSEHNKTQYQYLSSVKLHSKPTWIPQGLRASTLVHNCREPNNNWGLDPRSPEKISTCKVRNIMSHLKETLGTGSPCMYNTFRDTLPVKLGEFFNEMIILEEDGSCQ